MKKTLIALLLILCMLPVCAWAEMITITYTDGLNSAATLQVEAGSEFTLPEADYFKAPTGKVFYCWLVQTGGLLEPIDAGMTLNALGRNMTITADWIDKDAKWFSISIDPGEGTLAVDGDGTVTAAQGKAAQLPPYAVVKAPEGKSFFCWDVDGVLYPGGGIYENVQKDLTLKAVYVVNGTNTIAVGFDANGGMGSMNSPCILLDDTYTLPACEYTAPEGMRFKCWSVKGAEYAAGEQIKVTSGLVGSGLTIKAVWEALSDCAITFDGNGATKGEMTGAIVKEGSNYMLPQCEYERDGHNFAGWLVNGTGELKKPYDDITVTADTTIVASWEARIFEIHFSAGRGEDGNNSAGVYLKKAYGTSFALPTPEELGFTCEYFDFVGWQDETNDKLYEPGAAYVPMAFANIVAQWEPTKYKVTFLPGEGGTGTMEDGVGTHYDGYNLPECGFTALEGYEFKAWLLDGKEYPAGNSLFPTADMTVTALWQIKTYTLTYQTGDGMGAVRPVEDVEHGKTVTLAEPPEVDEKWTFTGWKIGDKTYAPGREITMTGDVTAVAQWKIRDVQISYENDEGETLFVDDTLTYGQSHTVLTMEELNAKLAADKQLTAPQGYLFKDWQLLNTRNEVIDTANPRDMLPVYSIWKLRANWVPEEPTLYTVSYNANGAEGSMTPVQVEAGTLYTIAEPNALDAGEGLQFDGWMINGQKYTPGQKVQVMGDIQIVAQWKVRTVSLTYQDADGNKLADPIEMNYGAEHTVLTPDALNLSAPTGYQFGGWAVFNNRGGKLEDVQAVSGQAMAVYSHWWIRPVWEEIPAVVYTVRFDANGGSGAMEPVSVEEGNTITLPACGFTAPAGKKFSSWIVGGVQTKVGTKLTVTSSMTILADWEALPVVMHTATFVDSNDPSKTYSFQVEDGGEFLLPSPADCGFAPLNGQTFAHWAFVRTGGVSTIPVGSRFFQVGSDVTFTAMWEMSEQTQTRVEQKSLDSLSTEEKKEIEKEMLAEMPAKLDTVEEIVAQLTVAAVKKGFEEEKVEVRDVTLTYSVDGGDTWIPATEENFPTAGITIELDPPEGTNVTDYEFVVTHMFTVDSERLGTKAGETETPEVTIKNGKIVVTLTGLSPVSVSWKEKPIDVALPKTGDASCLMGWIALLGASGAGLMGMKRRKK